jgi:2-aminoadipate transaminase
VSAARRDPAPARTTISSTEAATMPFTVEPQAEMRPGIVELRWGDPDPSLIPTAAIRDAAVWVADSVGAPALNYGVNEGPMALRAALAKRIAATEGRPVDATQLAVTNGVSPSIHLLFSQLVRPGDVVFMEDPGFSLAMRMARDLSLELVGVPLDGRGLDVDALADAVTRVRAEGRRPRMVYTVATYHNPTGVCLSDERRRRLVELAVREDLLVVEDDAYRELSYDGPPPPSLWRLAGDVDGADERVVRLGSFSKTLSPGLRCGWLTSGPARVKEFAERGVLDSAGCMSQFGACVCARLLQDGVYDANVRRLREAYGARRDALVDALREHLPAGCGVRRPAGGLFVLVTLPDAITAGGLVAAGEANGVGFSEGTRFSLAGVDRGIRLGFSMYAPEQLREGAACLGRTVREALERC